MSDQPQTPATFTAEPEVAYPPSVLPFRFTGSAGEYFRIWIVNTLLTVLTLGVYSAWAKIRSKQYFYRHTFVDDSSFEYLADPIAILKGRALIVAVLVAVALAEQFSVGLYLALVMLLLCSTPWVIVKALRFNARNSAYRNVRFAFRGTTADSYVAYLVGGAAYLFSCGVAAPYMQWRLSQFAVEGHTFGDAPFRFRTDAGDYFIAFLIAFAMSIPIFGLYMGTMMTMIFTSMSGDGAPDARAIESAMYVLPVFYALLIVPGAYLKARIANLFWGGIDIGEHRVESLQSFKEVLALQITNLLGIVVTLGLAIPWAKVRSHRYRVEHLLLHAARPLVVTAQHGAYAGSAFGDAATDLGEFDLDLG